ncbi:hypothetical protein RB653_010554 [Dictyostelium firmibasis]|uniref:Uncharacterized protein n=1 Tax=Dictyostelium firmibasis TaxID=79012 RepID=A0AAN7YN30_9MYCE
MVKNIKIFLSLFFVVVLGLLATTANAMVIGIDLGSQTFKVSLIKPGAFETVLNEQSGRKTVSSVGWFKDERLFSSDSFSVWARNPEQNYNLIQAFLGIKYKEGLVEEIGNGLPLGFKVKNDTIRNTVSIVYDDDVSYSAEELTGMLLRRVKDMASAYAGSSIKDCAITIPPFFTQQQRQSLLDAAQLAGLNVLSLIHDVNAAALTYAMDRIFLEKNQSVIFYDMGARHTSVSLVEFESHNEQIKGVKKNKTVSSVSVKSIEWDEKLGGYDFDMVIVGHLKQLLKKQIPSANVDDIKITIKLLKEVGKMKENLSVNQQAQIFIGSLVDDHDFQATVSRQQFEDLSKSLVERALLPLKRLIDSTSIKLKDIEYFEVVGGGIRIPFIQQALKDYLKRDTLDKHLNGDEAMSNGAAFYAASLTHYFKVKEIKLRDILLNPVDVEINNSNLVSGNNNAETLLEETEDNEENENNEKQPTINQGGLKEKKIQLFKVNSKLGIKKTVSFSSENGFSLFLNNPTINSPLATYIVSNVPTPGEKYNFTGKPKIHCSFRLTTSGIVVLEKAEAEITVSMIKPQPQPNKNTTTASTKKNATIETTNDGSTEEEEEEEETTTKEEGTIQEEKIIEYIQKTIRVPLNFTVKYNGGVEPLSKELYLESNDRINKLDQVDRILRELRQERNNLESFIYETKDKLDSNEEYLKCSTQEERDQLVQELDKTSNWLSDALDNDNTNTEEYRKQLKDIKKKADKIVNRVQQYQLVPVALEELEDVVDKVQPLFASASKDLNITAEELKETTDKIKSVSDWVEEKKNEFKLADYSKDLQTSSYDIKFKLYDLERTIKEILKKKKKPVKPSSSSSSKKDKSSKSSKEKDQKAKDQKDETERDFQNDGASDEQNQQFEDDHKVHDEL